MVYGTIELSANSRFGGVFVPPLKLRFPRIGAFMDWLSGIPEIERLSDVLEAGERVISIGGVTSTSAKAFVLSHLQKQTGREFVVITATNAESDAIINDIRFWRQANADAAVKIPDPEIYSLPAFETDPYSGVSPHAETLERRALALWRMSQKMPSFLALSAKSLITRTISPVSLAKLGASLTCGVVFSPTELIARFARTGFFREDPVSSPGQFSVRGGIVDVWPPDSELPLRIEFFGDSVESIRKFDPESQLSIARLNAVAIAPMRELPASPDDLKDWASLAEKRFSGSQFSRNLADRTMFAAQGETFSGWEFLLPLWKPLPASVFEYLTECIFVIDEPATVENELMRHYRSIAREHSLLAEIGEIGLEPHELFLTVEEIRNYLDAARRIEFRALGKTAAAADEEFRFYHSRDSLGQIIDSGNARFPIFLFPVTGKVPEVELISQTARRFDGKIADFVSHLRASRNSLRLLFVLATSGTAERLEEIFREYDWSPAVGSIRVGSLSAGFEMPSTRLAVYTENDIFGEIRIEGVTPRRSAAGRKSNLGAFVSDFRDLKPGDFVVHADHGIGRFEGLQKISAQGLGREFILILYADDAKLYVPVERLDLVSRYSSGEGITPSLDRLGGIGWQKTKARAKRAMRDMADELLRLYAERKLVSGYAFSPDAPWQHEFEDAFPYDLTTDQAAAIDDVKSDMEAPRPMDRLIIGDVGYGKTEVAMRAAFKAVMDGKQVAVLSPTTILAYQHFESFRRRFAAFPARVDLLSRFRRPKEQKDVVEATRKGDIDVLIGTHRILSSDVSVPKLGLIVVDEEQRFGVAHKEKLKRLKKKVDVLTLSATPIPRTLNMSLVGMRDMSVIETPPRDRLAINTQVVQFSEGVIRSAIELELARNGQVFFIHNRVETIETVAALVQNIVPHARIVIGHGQMSEKEMEQVMLDFIDYKYDVLIATTIIENGIDIPRANTIIINRADNYGLSQLYQLRGRVGRSNRRAYAYLLIPSEFELTPIARRRLTAIREFSDLGAGFRIAALDLELRGAGNILGGQQSGHLDALGFDLYTKMLERTIAEIRGEEIEDEIGVAINLGMDLSIPKEYISDTGQRLRTYKRISSADSEESLVGIRGEIEDRYGRIPTALENLFEFCRLRRLAESLSILSIDASGGQISIKLGEKSKVTPDSLMHFLSNNEGAAFSPNGILRFRLNGESPIFMAAAVLRQISA